MKHPLVVLLGFGLALCLLGNNAYLPPHRLVHTIPMGGGHAPGDPAPRMTNIWFAADGKMHQVVTEAPTGEEPRNLRFIGVLENGKKVYRPSPYPINNMSPGPANMPQLNAD